jgi:hypothetical protein
MTRNQRSLGARRRKTCVRRPEIELLEARLLLSFSGQLAVSNAVPDFNNLVVLGTTGSSGTLQAAGAVHSLSSLPQLSSLPGAKASIYLNFLGDYTANWGGYLNITTPVFNQDGDPTTFSDGELTTITNIWKYVAEDYAPFNINVTTVKPANMGHGFTQVIDIGGGGSWTGGTYGGISFVGSFTDPSVPNISFVFPNNLGNGTAKYVGDASSHEAGHAFGLVHQSLWDANGNFVAEYYSGPGNGTAPIMGNSYYAARSLWWNGTTDMSPTTMQDDMSIIASSADGFGYRADTAGSSMAHPFVLTPSGTQVSGSGIIISTTDQDYYSFATDGGQLSLSVTVPAPFNNLSAQAKLLDSHGNLVATGASNGHFGATITTSVAAGTYYFVVSGDGTYGDVGQYTVSGTIVPTKTPVPSAPGGLSATAGDGQVTLSWSAANGATSYNLYRGTSPGGEGATPYLTGLTATSYTDIGLTNGTTYYYTVKAVNTAGQSGPSSEASATPMPLVPAAPTGLSATASNGQVSLSWNAVAGAASYNLYRGTSPGGEGSTPYLTGLTATSYTDVGLTDGTTYYYTVTAVNPAGQSGQSSQVSASLPVTQALAIDSGGGAAGSFIADTDVHGGSTASITHAIDTSGVTNPAPQAVYQTSRYGNFTYSVPNLKPGATYTVRLHFAETHWNAAGVRLFNVSINGTQVLTNFDIFATAGGKYKAIVEQFTTVADSAGRITINYTTVRDNAKSSGIEIIAGTAPGANLSGAGGHASGLHANQTASGWFQADWTPPRGGLSQETPELFKTPEVSSFGQPSHNAGAITTWLGSHARKAHGGTNEFLEQWQLT